MSSSKLEPIQMSSQSKQRVKWQDSPADQLPSNSKIGRYYSRDHLNIEKRENSNGSKLKLQYYSDAHPEYKSQGKSGQNPDLGDSRNSRRKKLHSRNKERLRKGNLPGESRYHSQKITLSNSHNYEKVYIDTKKQKDQVLKITFKEPNQNLQNERTERIGTSHDQQKKRTIELAIKKKRSMLNRYILLGFKFCYLFYYVLIL
jgi:hypothetical protein